MLTHLIEIRQRILSFLVFFLLIFAFFFFLAPDLFTRIMMPLLHVLPKSRGLIATDVMSPVLTPLKLAMHASFLCSVPIALYHIWRFVVPALYQHERLFFGCILISSLLLFVCGVMFCFYAVLPWMFHLLLHALPVGVQFLPDIQSASHFITHMLFVFGICFQLPLACVLLVHFGCVSFTALSQCRPYMIVAAFTLGMLLTPPDVLSQVMLALPLWALFEIGLLCSWWVWRRR